ncbi:MAG: type transport system permease protein [Frankiaceae bacterium]|jgi:ABC-type transport system involved in multi-copper enzyme maturation permease subunit|nr:type transport system permease protein [Frankiaceae bacterium]
MRGLLSAELLRFRSRRLVRIVVLLAFAILLIVQIRVFFLSNRDVAGAHRKAERQAEKVTGGLRGQFAEDCAARKTAGSIDPQTDCSTWIPPEFGPRDGAALDAANFYQDPRMFARTALRQGAQAVAVAMAIFAVVIGASFIGAEWNAGTMQALLFWEPRRGRVLLAKAVGLVTGVVVITAALQVFCYGGLYLIAATRGSTEGLTAGIQTSILLLVLRGMAVVSITALLGYAIAGLARNTVAAIVAAFVYFVIVENLILGLRPGWQRFLVTPNVSAVMAKKVAVTAAHPHGSVFSGDTSLLSYHLTAARGAITLAIYLGVLLGIFYGTFQRRDVT